MRILITNDDGLGADGLMTLSDVVGDWGEIVTLAPESQQSGISHRITFERSLNLNKLSSNIYTVDGTPADCVRVALAKLNGHFDWVISGINDGANLGTEVFCSGTAAAAREASFSGIPAIAISQYRRKYNQPFDWQLIKPLASKVLRSLIEAPIATAQWYNVNLPDIYAENKSGEPVIQFCGPDPNPLPLKYSGEDASLDLAFKYSDRDRETGLDVDLCLRGDVTITRFDYPTASR